MNAQEFDSGDATRRIGTIPNGSAFGHFRIVEKIGDGGMGEVYIAEDTDLKRRVALKFLSPSLSSDADFRARFRREAQAVAALNHPNIITIHEVNEYQGRPFFSMEFIQGRSLSELVKDRKLDCGRAIDIACQICEGLAEAHDAGMIHRDVKPANILIDNKYHVKILDFGLAKAVTSAGDAKSGVTLGTISYMSPEQITGTYLTPSSDLFSLGIVLYKMVTGQMPFSGEYDAAVLYAIVNDVPKSASSLNQDVPVQLERVISKLLQKELEKRYQDVREVLTDLLACLPGNIEAKVTILPNNVRISRAAQIVLMVLTIVVVIVGFPSLTNVVKRTNLTRTVVAVLPFENIGSAEDDYFADGMTDAIATNLARNSDLGVISRASSMMYKKSNKGSRQIGEELGVSYLLTGTIQLDKSAIPNLVKINTSLVRVNDDTYLWTQPYERTLEKVFVIQSEIAAEVTRSLKIVVSSSDRIVEPIKLTDNLEAYDYFLRGNDYFNAGWDLKNHQFAIEMYQHAVELDSSFAAAYAMLARAQASMYWESFDRSDERCEMAEQAANRALSLQPDLVEGHLAKGYYYYHCRLDYDRALNEFDIALRKQPNNADLYNAIAAVQRRQGKLEPSAVNFTRALELDPRSQLKAFDVGLTYGMMRQFVPAMKYLDKTISLAPDWSLAHIYKAWLPILRDGDTASSRRTLLEASDKADLERSKYFWWLSRVIEPDLDKVLLMTKQGTDTAAYFLQIAQINRLKGNHQKERIYADSARRILRPQISARPDDARLQSYYGLACAGLRLKKEAIEHGARALELLPTSKEAFDAPFWIVNLAETFVIFGDEGAAIDQLKLLLSIPGFVSIPYLKLDPLWMPLHNNSGFKKLLVTGNGT